MRYAYLLVLCCVLSGCASVTQIETLNASFAKPVFKSIEPGIVEPTPSGKDYRERTVNKSLPHFTILWKEIPKDFLSVDVNFLEERIVSSHSTFGKYIPAPAGSSDYTDFFKTKDIDVVLELNASKTNESLSLTANYKDPVLSQNFGSSLFAFKLEKEPSSSKKKKFEIFHDKTGLVPLFPSVLSYYSEVSSPKESEIQTVLSSTLRGKVSVFSTTPGTQILLDGKEIGKAPLIDYSMLNGKHVLSFSKPGKDPVQRSILIRAGKTSRIFQEWNDDISQGTFVLSSYPSGLDVIVAGQKKGKTQFAESGVPYGSYSVQYVRTKGSENFEYAKSQVVIRPKSIASLALPISLEEGIGWEAADFWNPSSISPHFSATFPDKLTFGKSANLPSGWYGVFSEDMIPDRIRAEVKLGVSQELGGKLGFFVTDKESHSLLVIVDKTDFHLVQFSPEEKESIVRSSYRWKSEEPLKGREISIETDPEKKLLKLYLGNSLILEKAWDFTTLWNIAILTPSDSFLNGNPLRGIKIQYPDMIQFEEKIKK
ncbi:LIC10124 family lipoprotein [Leptospira idonii]|uniref:PEGA domain-containing protein n=1 Tax=Leptospira idonii TaxID=1193500 RepID=A0A4R9LX93_9LEPT|nr:PEGA domain-containing protein [Leptospira idonii]TGN18924.1 PEGA domain-containing protein [Leptospira idonii]